MPLPGVLMKVARFGQPIFFGVSAFPKNEAIDGCFRDLL
jgi:hypothetical protein